MKLKKTHPLLEMAKRKISREELVEIRKREQARKELEQGLMRTIKEEEYEREFNARKMKGANPWIIGLIKFFTIFLFLEMIVYILSGIIPFFSVLGPLWHVITIGFGIMAVVVQEHIFNNFIENILRKLGYL